MILSYQDTDRDACRAHRPSGGKGVILSYHGRELALQTGGSLALGSDALPICRASKSPKSQAWVVEMRVWVCRWVSRGEGPCFLALVPMGLPHREAMPAHRCLGWLCAGEWPWTWGKDTGLHMAVGGFCASSRKDGRGQKKKASSFVSADPRPYTAVKTMGYESARTAGAPKARRMWISRPLLDSGTDQHRADPGRNTCRTWTVALGISQLTPAMGTPASTSHA